MVKGKCPYLKKLSLTLFWQKFRENNVFTKKCVEKVGILLSRFLRRNWKKFRENKTNANLALFT